MTTPGHGLPSAWSGPTADDLPLPAPRTQRVLVRVSGIVDASNGAALAETITASLGVVLHVVVDLAGVTQVTPSGLGALLDLSRTATRRGTCLHITGVAHVHRDGVPPLRDNATLASRYKT